MLQFSLSDGTHFMKNIGHTKLMTAAFLLLTTTLSHHGRHVAHAGDWPQILGPHRTGVASPDEQLADTWPATGPREAWRREVGSGYAGVAVVDGKAFLFHRIDDREITEALDATSGKVIWKTDHPTRFQPQVGGGDGPLCTPTVSNNKVITYGAQGMLTCLSAQTGEVLWQHQTHEEFDAGEGIFWIWIKPAGDWQPCCCEHRRPKGSRCCRLRLDHWRCCLENDGSAG